MRSKPSTFKRGKHLEQRRVGADAIEPPAERINIGAANLVGTRTFSRAPLTGKLIIGRNPSGLTFLANFAAPNRGGGHAGVDHVVKSFMVHPGNGARILTSGSAGSRAIAKFIAMRVAQRNAIATPEGCT